MKTNKQAGFTITEIMIAILILSSTLVVILSLQTSIISRNHKDTQQFQAMLLARSILADLETKKELDDMNERYSALDAIKEFELYDDQDIEEKDFDGLDVELEIGDIEIPLFGEFEPIEMKKVNVKVLWGPGDGNNIEIFYYAANE